MFEKTEVQNGALMEICAICECRSCAPWCCQIWRLARYVERERWHSDQAVETRHISQNTSTEQYQRRQQMCTMPFIIVRHLHQWTMHYLYIPFLGTIIHIPSMLRWFRGALSLHSPRLGRIHVNTGHRQASNCPTKPIRWPTNERNINNYRGTQSIDIFHSFSATLFWGKYLLNIC